MYKIKLNQIKEFLKPYADMPKQGTAAWKKMRESGIGGSELDLMLKDEQRLVGQKVNLVRGMGNDILSCNWGSVFEQTFRQITSIVLRTPIFEASSIPSCEVAGKTYSMDGMGVVRFLCDEWNGTPYDFFMFFTTLFEFKCTFSREPVPGQIYKSYLPQVLSGMSDLGIPEIALYMESVFRICRFEELGNNTKVEDWLHQSRSAKSWLSLGGNPHAQLPMCYGFLGLYMQAELPDDPDANCIYTWLQHGNMDFAKLDSPSLFCKLLKFIRLDYIKVWGSEIAFAKREWKRAKWFVDQRIPIHEHHVDMDNQAVAFHRWCADHDQMPLGVLGWKLLDVNTVTVEKQPGYTKQFADKIHEVLEKIKHLNLIDDISDRLMEYNKIYNIVDTEDNTESLSDLL